MGDVFWELTLTILRSPSPTKRCPHVGRFSTPLVLVAEVGPDLASSFEADPFRPLLRFAERRPNFAVAPQLKPF